MSTLPTRLESKIKRIPDGCWLWIAATNASGYGAYRLGPRMHPAHRVVYEAVKGFAIPKGLDLDHLCRVRNCVNPNHLEPVTRQINLMRGTPGAWMKRRAVTLTHCPSGHPYSGENLYVKPDGKRVCRACTREAGRRYKEKRRAA